MPARTAAARAEQTGPASCRLRMQRPVPYLLVHDASNCGCANVRFSGIYRRQP